MSRDGNNRRSRMQMTQIRVFDPPMCCSTGVCGPSVDPKLVRFAADLEWLAQQGPTVHRHNLAQEPAAFVQQPEVKRALEEKGEACLPLVLRDDEIVSEGGYPTRTELAELAGVPAPEPGSEPEPMEETAPAGPLIRIDDKPLTQETP